MSTSSINAQRPVCRDLEKATARTAPVVRLRPSNGWQLINIRELWAHRELLMFLTWRDVKVRYKQTMLGAAWAILQPVMMMVVFSLFFGRVARVPSGDVPYPLFVYAGLLPWTFFATAIANAGNSVVGSEKLITKVYFPRLAIPFASVGAALVDLAIAFTVLFVLLAWHGVALHPNMLLVPPLIGIITAAALGVGTLLAALNVSYRDFRYVLPFMIQLWLFATPSVYMQLESAADDSAGGLSGAAQLACQLNPMNALIAAFRASVLGEAIPWTSMLASSATVLLVLLTACLYFRKVEDHFADVI